MPAMPRPQTTSASVSARPHLHVSPGVRLLPLLLIVLALPLAGCVDTSESIADEPKPASWELTRAQWERQMVDHGDEVGRFMLAQTDENQLLAAQYYDGAKVFRQIAAYTGDDEPWLEYADSASSV